MLYQCFYSGSNELTVKGRVAGLSELEWLVVLTLG